MKNAVLRGVKIVQVDFENKIKENKKIELGFAYSYNVKYSSSNTCVCEFTAKITEKAQPQEFKINVVANGVFSFEPDSKKEELHVQTYNELFPHVRSFVTTLTANAGIPPIIMPFIDISQKEIYRFEMGGNKPEQ